VTASYDGDGNFNTSTAAQTATVTVSTATTSTSVTSSKPFSTLGDVVTFTATVTPQGGATTPVTGFVRFFVDDVRQGADVAVSNGQAQIVLSVPVGQHTVKATYLGSTANADYSGSTGQTTQTVASFSSMTTISVPPGTRVTGEVFDATATV